MFRWLPRRADPLLTLLVLVFVPGLTLAYLGLRGVTERENSLRTQYLATATLVRDRLAAELTRREEKVWRSAGTHGTFSSGAPSAVSQVLRTLERDNPWVTRTFLVNGAGLATRSLHTNWPRNNRGPRRDDEPAAGLVAAAETAEFLQDDLEAALRHYREASDVVPRGSAARAFLFTRIGRTLMKMDRPTAAVEPYRQALAEAGHAVDRNGLPFAVIALVQIGDAFARLGRADEEARAHRELLEYIVNHPWDLADGSAVYLRRALSQARGADPALLARGEAIAAEVTDVDWLLKEVMPKIRTARQSSSADDDEGRRLVVQRGGQDVLAGFRPIDESAAPPAILGYTAESALLADEMLTGVVRDVRIDSRLSVRITGSHTIGDGPGTPSAGAEALATAPLFPIISGRHVAIFDSEGRSVAQLVARERWSYGALVLGMLSVMAAGLVLITRTSRRAAELSQAKTEFVANVSHELKTPLALIRMFGETLESGIVPDEDRRRDFAGVIRRESERLTHLINNVLDLGRIDAGTKRYELVRGDVVATVREALEAYRPLFERLGFEIESDMPNYSIDVSMDRDAIVQSLVNLFQNAIKYSDGGAYVRVRVTRDNDWISVSVTDRGVGIARDEVPRIFDPYYRAAGARGSFPAGSGLGLSIVQHAVAAHGGRIEVASTPGAGSTFTLVLPATPAVAAASCEPTVVRAET